MPLKVASARERVRQKRGRIDSVFLQGEGVLLSEIAVYCDGPSAAAFALAHGAVLSGWVMRRKAGEVLRATLTWRPSLWL